MVYLSDVMFYMSDYIFCISDYDVHILEKRTNRKTRKLELINIYTIASTKYLSLLIRITLYKMRILLLESISSISETNLFLYFTSKPTGF